MTEETDNKLPKRNDTVVHRQSGNIYRVTAIATHTETGELLIIYHKLGTHGEDKSWARPVDGKGGWTTPANDNGPRFVPYICDRLSSGD